MAAGTQGLLTAQSVAFLDQLPLAFPDWAQAAALAAVSLAWGKLLDEASLQGQDVEELDENEITTLLCNTLNAMRRRPDPSCPEFSGEAFQKVTRGESAEDYTGQSIDKRPDLQLRTLIPPAGGLGWEEPTLYVEVKIVDGRSHPVRRYCRDGIARYVKGQYAWTMRCGLMLAYARESAAIEPTLVDFLAQDQAVAEYNVVSLPCEHPGPLSSQVRGAYVSAHGRLWKHRNGREPGVIELTHLWLRSHRT